MLHMKFILTLKFSLIKLISEIAILRAIVVTLIKDYPCFECLYANVQYNNKISR